MATSLSYNIEKENQQLAFDYTISSIMNHHAPYKEAWG